MPVGEILAGAAGAASSIINPIFQAAQNRKNREFARQERERQYQTELEFWRLNNAYNHPSEQMARLREGGLNPHLVYGNGAVANSASAPSAPAPARWQGVAPQVNPDGAVSMLDAFQNIQGKKLQNDNFRAQNTLLKQEAALQKLGLLKKAFDLDIDYETRDSLIKQIVHSADLRETQAASAYNQELRNMDLHTVEMELKKAGLKGQQLLNRINQEKALLFEAGFNPNDPTWLRYLGRILMDAFGEDPLGQGVNAVKSIINGWK